MKSTSLLLLMSLVATQLLWAEDEVTTAKEKSAVCASCHGEDGNSVAPTWPKLAGQHQSYLVKQLQDFKAGRRKNEVMSPIAASLSDTDMAELAAYYAQQKRTTPEEIDASLAAPGKKLYRGGNADTGVPACMACHGPNGVGNPAANFPSINSQHAGYLAAQLTAYQTGARANDRAEMMRNIAKKMSAEEIEAVSAYASGLH